MELLRSPQSARLSKWIRYERWIAMYIWKRFVRWASLVALALLFGCSGVGLGPGFCEDWDNRLDEDPLVEAIPLTGQLALGSHAERCDGSGTWCGREYKYGEVSIAELTEIAERFAAEIESQDAGAIQAVFDLSLEAGESEFGLGPLPNRVVVYEVGSEPLRVLTLYATASDPLRPDVLDIAASDAVWCGR